MSRPTLTSSVSIAAFSLLLSAAVVFVALTAGARERVLVPDGATWRYLDDGSDQGTPWKDAGFDDSLWSSGSAELGHGDGDEVTLVGFGPNPGDKHITTYFRRVFDLEGSNDLVRADLRLLRDDGAIVYLNGIEVARSNMPEGKVFFDTCAWSGVGRRRRERVPLRGRGSSSPGGR